MDSVIIPTYSPAVELAPELKMNTDQTLPPTNHTAEALEPMRLLSTPASPDLPKQPDNTSPIADIDAHIIPQPSSVLRDDISLPQLLAPASFESCDTTRQEPIFPPATVDAMADKDIEKGDDGMCDVC